MAIAEFIVETNYPSRRIIRLRRIIHPSINSVLRRIMEQNSSEADSSVSTSSRRANRRTIRLRRDYPSQKFISRRKADGFLTKFPHERDWFLYFCNSLLNSPKHQSCNPRKKYLEELWSKIRLRLILIIRRIIRLTDNASRLITRL